MVKWEAVSAETIQSREYCRGDSQQPKQVFFSLLNHRDFGVSLEQSTLFSDQKVFPPPKASKNLLPGLISWQDL